MSSEGQYAVAQSTTEDVKRAHDLVTKALGNSLDNDQGNVDKEIEALELVRSHADERLRYLRIHRNHLSLIHQKLPNEILSMIFQCCHLEITLSECRAKQLLCFAGVSRLWRKVAFGTSSLWNQLESLPIPLLDIFITNSKQIPLVISYKGRHYSDYNAVVVPHLYRWKVYRVDVDVDPEVVLMMLLTPAPALETLDLNLEDHDSESHTPDPIISVDSNTSPSVGVPFAGCTPRLRNLMLGGLFIPFSSSIYNGLTKLRLARIQFTKHETVVQLFDALRSSPLLEELSFDDIDTTLAAEEPFPADIMPLEFSHLRCLNMLQRTLPRWLHRFILERVIMPPTSKLGLEMRMHWFRTNEFIDLDFVLPRASGPHFGLRNLLGASHLELKSDWDETTSAYEALAIEGKAPHISGSSLFSFKFTIISDYGTDFYEQTIRRIFTPNIQHIVLCNFNSRLLAPIEPIVDAFTAFLDNHMLIRTIIFSECESTFLDCLVVTASRHLCPKLEELHFYGSPIDEYGLKLVEVVESRTHGLGSDATVDSVQLQRLFIGRRFLFEEIIAKLESRLDLTIQDDPV